MSVPRKTVRLAPFVAIAAVCFGLALFLGLAHLGSTYSDTECTGGQEGTSFKELYSLKDLATKCVYHRRNGEIDRQLAPEASTQQALAWAAIGIGAAGLLVITTGLTLSVIALARRQARPPGSAPPAEPLHLALLERSGYPIRGIVLRQGQCIGGFR